uniref:NADH-ubiquinone oxidoreductase chain 4 n=1 Tax=Myrianida brachycephala TaxID=884646 RepID=A0A1C9UZD1_MYRBC|nr:NADH dehydrogenase subunit 4 [Myrianida brachycephala]AOR87135.1 NADH dehydrogenase subunit 4 [Myrianida brachycephala]
MLKVFFPIITIIIISPQWHISCCTLTILFMLSIKMLFFSTTFSSMLSNFMFLDTMSAALILLSIWVSMMMFLASFSNYFMNKNISMFNALILLLLIILIMSFSLNNMLMFYMTFEMSLIPTMMVIMGWGYQPERINASYYLMLYTISASLPLLLIMTLLYMKKFSLNFLMNFDPYPSMFFTSSMMMALAFLVKMPMYLTHLWLPKAHVEAPAAGSMILAAILLKLGAYGLMRLMYMMPTILTPIYYLLMMISLWGVIAAASICTRQHDMKSLIAYSSVSHMGLVILGILSSYKWGWDGAIMMMIAHGLSSSGLFFLANSSYESTNTRSILLTKGMMALVPIMSLWWFLMSIANMGAPPTLNILSEIILLSSILSSSLWVMMFILPSLFLAMAYSFILFTSISHGPLSSYSVYLSPSFTRNSITSLAHITPLFLMFLNPSIFNCFML